MKKGKVKALALSHKNGTKILRAGDTVTENDVMDFDRDVKRGFIEPDKLSKKAEEAKKAEK